MTSAHEYFSDREFGPRTPTQTEFDDTTWQALTLLVRRLGDRGDFGNSFPEKCFDAPFPPISTDYHALDVALAAEVPSWLGWSHKPDVATACDFLEFCHRHVAKASPRSYHQFFDHHHLRFDLAEGRRDFRDEVNLLRQRNGIALRMTDDGLMERVLDDPTGEAVLRAVFQTRDAELDLLLEEARSKFLKPEPRARQEAL